MRALSKTPLTHALSVATAFALVAVAPNAGACGGLFCSSVPVDQTAEHILFTVNPDTTVTAIVQISYFGQKDDFAWIVPVPGKPTLDATFPERAFQALDAATAPQYTKNMCYQGESFGAVPGAATGAAAPPATNGVTVLAQQVVGPYDSTTLEGTSADVIVKWLQDDGYRITDKMIPVIAPYVADGMKFVALRLTPDAGVSDISPLSMTYPGNQPMIPIKLTAVAAQPEMGIVAWVLANQRYAPDNYVDLKIPDKLIQFDPSGYQSNNYLTLVSQLADTVGGEAFVTEYAKPSSEVAKQVEQSSLPPPSVAPDAATARDKLLGLLAGSPFITRLYTRISAEEMLDDPRFRIANDQSEVSNIHDLTDPNFDPTQCTPPPPPPDPCEFNYCGRQGVCAPTAESMAAIVMGAAQTTTPSCVCANGATARPTRTGANGQFAMYCEPLAMNYDGASPAGSTGPALVPACEGFDCGPHGKCAPMNGNPTCVCEAGYGATVQTTYDSTAGIQKPIVSCVAAAMIPPFPVLPPPGQQSLTPKSSPSSDVGFCSVGRIPAPRASGSALLWLATALGAVFMRRRKRH